jgi:hypothetical protein
LEGVNKVTAAALVKMEDFARSQPTDDGPVQLRSNQAVQTRMTGIYSEVSLSIPASTLITMPPGLQGHLELTAVEVSKDLVDAATRLSLRRSENGVEYGIMGPTLLISPSQATVIPAVAITLPFNTTNVDRTANTQRLAIYKWNQGENQWVEVPGSREISDGVLAASTTSFGFLTVIAVPMTVPKIVDTSLYTLVDLKDYADFITATELIMKRTVIANASAEGPYKETGIYIPKGTLVTLLKAGLSRVFMDFADLSLEQNKALFRSQNRAMVSERVTRFSPVTNFSHFAINLTIMYSIDRLKAVGRRTANDARIAVHQWNDANGNWQEKEGSIPKDGVATFYTSSLGAFAVMTVPMTPTLLESPKADSSTKLITVAAAIGVTCLMLMCACIPLAICRRNLGKKELPKVKSAMERRKEPKPDIEPEMLRLARVDKKVSDKFQPADDVSALEISVHMAKRLGKADDHVIDPAVLILAQHLAESESPRDSITGAQAGSASVYDISSVQQFTSNDDRLSQVSCVGIYSRTCHVHASLLLLCLE